MYHATDRACTEPVEQHGRGMRRAVQCCVAGNDVQEGQEAGKANHHLGLRSEPVLYAGAPSIAVSGCATTGSQLLSQCAELVTSACVAQHIPSLGAQGWTSNMASHLGFMILI